MSGLFTLDPRLLADTLAVASLQLCELRLMKDARYPWLILVPRRAEAVEISDLDDADQTLLWRETALAGNALRAVTPCEKLNLGTLGNIVRQLHVHVVARHAGDAAWPGPVWGHGAAVPYDKAQAEDLITALRKQPW